MFVKFKSNNKIINQHNGGMIRTNSVYLKTTVNVFKN